MSKLNEEELLGALEEWTDFYKPNTRLKKLTYWLPKDEQAFKQIKEMLQKPEVTEEWIAEMVNKVFAKLLAMHGAFGRPQQMRSILKDFIRSLVEEIPMKKVIVTEEFLTEKAKLFVYAIMPSEIESTRSDIHAAKEFLRTLFKEMK